MDLLVVDPGGSQCLLKLGETHDVDVDELDHLVTLGGAAGLVPHDSAHDPADEGLHFNFKPTNGAKSVYLRCCDSDPRQSRSYFLSVAFKSSVSLRDKTQSIGLK